MLTVKVGAVLLKLTGYPFSAHKNRVFSRRRKAFKTKIELPGSANDQL